MPSQYSRGGSLSSGSGSQIPSYVLAIAGLLLVAIGAAAAILLLPQNSSCPGGIVCGSDGNTYGNSCLAKSAGVSVRSNGSCPLPCVDSDGGKDIFTEGTAADASAPVADSCDGAGVVVEAVCDAGQASTLRFPCPAGYECSGNACVKSSCVDSDGKNASVRGTVVYGTANYTDSCDSSSVVKEFYCDNGASASIGMDCGSGYSCQDGACIPTPCMDSDGGQDTSVAGTVTKGSASYQDWCDGVSVVEYSCDGQDVRNQTLQCQDGFSCRQGRCVEDLCSDSDHGLDQFIKGTTAMGQTTRVDSCYSSTSVLEYYCPSNMSISSTVLSCGAGSECSDGICKAAACVSSREALNGTDEEALLETYGSSDSFTIKTGQAVRLNSGYLIELVSVSSNQSGFRLYRDISDYRDGDPLCTAYVGLGNSTTSMCSRTISRLKVSDVDTGDNTATLQINTYYVAEYFSEDGTMTDWTDNASCPDDVVYYSSFTAEFFPSIDTDSSGFNLYNYPFRLMDENATLKSVTSSSVRFSLYGKTYTLEDGDTFSYKNQTYSMGLTFSDLGGITKMEVEHD